MLVAMHSERRVRQDSRFPDADLVVIELRDALRLARCRLRERGAAKENHGERKENVAGGHVGFYRVDSTVSCGAGVNWANVLGKTICLASSSVWRLRATGRAVHSAARQLLPARGRAGARRSASGLESTGALPCGRRTLEGAGAGDGTRRVPGRFDHRRLETGAIFRGEAVCESWNRREDPPADAGAHGYGADRPQDRPQGPE